jgi:hypothetical protein
MKKLILYLKNFVLNAVAVISKQFRWKRRRQKFIVLEEVLFI